MEKVIAQKRSLIILKEWSSRVIDDLTMKALINDPVVHRLCHFGVIQLAVAGSGFSLSARDYVGRVALTTIDLRICPRIDASYAEVLAHTSRHEKLAFAEATGSEQILEVSVPLANALAQAVETYFLFGALRRYERSSAISAFPRGRIEIPSTLRLRARGITERVVIRRNVLRPASDEENALRIALRMSEATVLASTSSDKHTLTTIRWALRSLPQGPTPPLEVLKKAASSASETDHRPYIRDLFRIVSLVLDGGSGVFDGAAVICVPFGLFVNMTRLLESAVRNSISASLSDYRSINGNIQPQDFLVEPLSTTKPDVVLTKNNQSLVLDIKDKAFGTPTRADIYEIFSFCAGIGAKGGVLVYLNDAFSGLLPIGEWRASIKLWKAALRPHNFNGDIESLAFALRRQYGD